MKQKNDMPLLIIKDIMGKDTDMTISIKSNEQQEESVRSIRDI